MSSSALSRPAIVDIHTVNPDIIAIRVKAQTTVKGQQVTYTAQPGDVISKHNWVMRDGQFLGYLVDPEKGILRLADQILGDPLKTDWINTLDNFQISSREDSSYSSAITPEAVYCKSKPIESQLARLSPHDYATPLTHTVYLKLPAPLQEGATYTLDFLGDELADTSYQYSPTTDRSEAVHVSQLGFDPEDPAKVAFLSQWMGHGGALDYQAGTPFWLIDQASGEKVYEGTVALSKAKEEAEDARGKNYNGTDVYMMDFSDFQAPGSYRVAVDGVGTSFAFDIAENTWEDAFYVSARGFFHQRSGIPLEQPYTDYERPRPFHPDDGVKIYQSTVPLMDTNMGLNLQSVRAFDALTATKTEALVPEAWGGWFDAGDWDRRIQHLEVTRQLIELAATNPDYFKGVNLNLPESANQIPDIVDEALWGLDVFRRLQTPEGGIRGGIESAAHPKTFESSWMESNTIMVYGPGIWSSYVYTAAAAQAATFLATLDPARSQDYRDSALRAMQWAEQEYAVYTGPTATTIDDYRNLAALELYRLTEDNSWHQLFLETTAFTDPEASTFEWRFHNHEEAAYVYSQMDLADVDATVQANARNALLKAADEEINNIDRTGFKWQKHPYTAVAYGSSMGHPDVTTLFRAHQLSGETKYLQAGILGLQFTAGANPDNMVFTTGLGERHPADPLVVDALATGKPAPPGITVFGPFDYGYHSALEKFKDNLAPEYLEWPTTENFFDIYQLVPVNEFTVMQTMAPTAYGFGYLAALDYVPPGTVPAEDLSDIENDGIFPPSVPGVQLTGTRARDVLQGTPGDDIIDGRGGKDILDGGAGQDYLNGAWGPDVLNGGTGDDILLGGSGRNTLTGGDGRDTFELDRRAKTDTITDFVFGQDWLNISAIAPASQLDSNQDGRVDGAFLGTVGNDLRLDLRSLGGGQVILQGQADQLNDFSLSNFAVAVNG